MPEIGTQYFNLAKDIENVGYDEKDGGGRSVNTLTIDGVIYNTSSRFFTSLATNMGFPTSIFNLFTPEEVFKRLVRMNKSVDLCLTYEVGKEANNLLGCCKPTKSVIDIDAAKKIISDLNPASVKYRNGIISFVNPVDPNANGGGFIAAGDNFAQRVSTEIPIDGFGNVSTYLSLLRKACDNGATCMAPMFRNSIKLPDEDADIALVRYIKYFNDADGFDSLKEKLDLAAKTPLSLHELGRLYKVIEKGDVCNAENVYKFGYIADKLDKLSGMSKKYKLSSFSEIPAKKAAMLPTDLTVYEAFNIATEITTHFRVGNPNFVHAFVGDTLATQFDLQDVITLDVKDQVAKFFTAN